MTKRALGAVLCCFLLTATATATYAGFTVLGGGKTLELEPSLFPVGTFDDSADAGYTGGVFNGAVRDKTPFKLHPVFKVKSIRYPAPPAQLAPNLTHPFTSQQELYRYQEVFRI